MWGKMIEMNHRLISCFILAIYGLALLCGCDKIAAVDGSFIAETGPVISEISVSADGVHRISSYVTRLHGMGIDVDGEKRDFDDYSIRYCPVIDNKAHYAWVSETKGKGYEVVWEGKSILHSAACIDHLIASCTKALVVVSDTDKFLTQLYLIEMSNGGCTCIKNWQSEYVEEICRFGVDKFGVLTSRFDEGGNKNYNLYKVDSNDLTIEAVAAGITTLLTFPFKSSSSAPENLVVDCVQTSDNNRYLYNALRLFSCVNDAFAYGNNFRGRISWGESQRLRGLCELYLKTNNSSILNRINEVVSSILSGRNSFIGIDEDEWNPGFLWSAKCYSIGGAPVCTVVETCEILSALLYACNEGLVSNKKEIILTSKRAYDYFDQWYKDGHYYLPKGMPVATDGILVPWNHQSSLAEVALGLYLETGEEKYLTRCNELIGAFMTEWEEEEDRIYWHYWPIDVYRGWLDDGRSVNMPTCSASEDKLYEDASHAGISVRLLSRYIKIIHEGIIGNSVMNKIESNMKYFCFMDGFSRFISGDETYKPRAWHYWISPYFALLHNNEFNKYVRQGYLHCFPFWDSSGALYANANLFHPELSEGIIVIERKEMDDISCLLKTVMTIKLSREELFDYMGINSPTIN